MLPPDQLAPDKMDGPTIDQADLNQLSDKDKLELRQFIQNEQQRTRIQARMRPLP